MEQKVVLITGGANGIGKAMAYKFFANNCFVAIFDYDENALAIIANEFGKENCFLKQVDISSASQIKNAMKELKKITGNRLDVVCANAGILYQESFDKLTAEQHKKMIDVNNFGVLNTIKATLPALKETPNSKLIITSSSSAVFGMPNFAVYSATKSFLKSLTESLAVEFKKFDIKVCSIMPLYVSTNMLSSYTKKQRALIKSSVTPAQVANIAYKASLKTRRLHYYSGFQMNLLIFLSRILPAKLFSLILSKILKAD